MDRAIEQLVEMGATAAQARAAWSRYGDVMQAAERIFEGHFDNVVDGEEETPMDSASARSNDTMMAERNVTRLATPEEDEDVDIDSGGEEDDGDYIDYDSDIGDTEETGRPPADIDPYSGIFFSKDRREVVIEVEEDPRTVLIPGTGEQVKLMTQGQWMKGCPEGGEQAFLFGLYSQLSEGACPCPQQCGATVTRKISDFFAIFPEFSTYTGHLRRIVQQSCSSCSTIFCFACGETISGGEVGRPTTKDDDPLFHCPNLQGVILGVGLSMLEQAYTDQTSEKIIEAAPKAEPNKKRKADGGAKSASAPGEDDDDDVYYAGVGKKARGGIGYAGNVREDTSGQLEAQAAQHAKDEKIGTLLTRLHVYLPSLHREGGGQTSDYLVHPTALAHLRRRFNTVCSSLLRNDSLADMSDRAVLYFELLAWLETISSHEALASMMAMPCMVPVSVKAVAAKKPTKGGRPIRERTIVYEGSSGPRELLEAIVIQARAALRGLESNKAPDSEPEEMTEEQKRMTNDTKGKAKEAQVILPDEHLKLLNFCQRIVATANAIDRSLRETKGDAFVDRLHKSLPQIHTSSSSTVQVHAGATDATLSKVYVEWASRVRFEYCDLTIPTTKNDEAGPEYMFFYNNEARALGHSDIPKRSLAIAKELAILTTNLPVAWDSSIFLRVDESRVDIIKALITGPEGTPYHNGCYLFDIFLGPSYNQSPPSVKYMTTNGGKFRFNPNLYADGKVCLSLLGTWSGPGWVAGKSTLLQVLISIQSMILCEEPYLNEPGWASSAGTPQSHAYSANVRRMVVKTAMLGNLKDPPKPFRTVIRTHFMLKARSLAQQLDQWVTQDDGRPTEGHGGYHRVDAGSTSSTELKKDVEELKRLLKQLEEKPGLVEDDKWL